MIEEKKFTTEVNEDNTPKIYSRNAIWVFSVIFAPIFGGVLLRQNLIDCEKKKEANIVLLTSIAMTVLTFLIVNNTKNVPTYILNLAWGAILTEYFFKKYFPNENHQYKKIWKALIISVIIIIPFLLAIIHPPTE